MLPQIRDKRVIVLNIDKLILLIQMGIFRVKREETMIIISRIIDGNKTILL
jgi:hypothetical protein